MSPHACLPAPLARLCFALSECTIIIFTWGGWRPLPSIGSIPSTGQPAVAATAVVAAICPRRPSGHRHFHLTTSLPSPPCHLIACHRRRCRRRSAAITVTADAAGTADACCRHLRRRRPPPLPLNAVDAVVATTTTTVSISATTVSTPPPPSPSRRRHPPATRTLAAAGLPPHPFTAAATAALSRV